MTATTRLRQLQREAIRRFGGKSKRTHKPRTVRAYPFIRGLHEYQRAFWADKSKTKAAICSRRAGKTSMAARHLLQEALDHDDCLCAYIALTRNTAKRLLWKELKALDRKYKLKIRFNETELVAEFPNGSQIILTGAKNVDDIEKLRGHAFRLVYIDECASFKPHIEELVEEVLEPTMMDSDGTMCMIGTPGSKCLGMFFDVTTGKRSGWSVHKWTFKENPYIPHASKWLARRMKQHGWDEQHPVYLREWCGKWVRDTESLCYAFNSQKNTYEKLPSGYHWEYILGVDLGHDDSTAFVVGAFSRDLPDFYILDNWEEGELDVADVAERIQALRVKYKFFRIVVDTGGLGKMIVETFKRRWRIPMKPAEKKDKKGFIETMNADFHAARVRVQEDAPVIEEWTTLPWDDSREGEDPNFDNNIADAALYAYRESRHYAHVPTEPAPPKGSRDYYEKVAQELEQADLDDLEEGDEVEELWNQCSLMTRARSKSFCCGARTRRSWPWKLAVSKPSSRLARFTQSPQHRHQLRRGRKNRSPRSIPALATRRRIYIRAEAVNGGLHLFRRAQV